MFAGSSLTDVLIEAEADFEALNPAIDIRLNLAGSNALARQIADGGRADLFIPADVDVIDDMGVTGITTTVALASNRLVMIVPVGSSIPSAVGTPTPAEVLAWADSFARCATGVPCGDSADGWIMSETGLPSVRTISLENNVRAVLAKVRAGEVDVGLVYATDALAAAGEVHVLDLGENAPRTRIEGSLLEPNGPDGPPGLFLDYLASPAGQQLFADTGFGAP